MIHIWLTYGLPASGKSTWARNTVAANPGTVVRVNMDDIRNMLGFGANGPLNWTKELEQVALAVQDKAILSAVAAGKNVIVDNTHIQKNMPKRIKRLFDGEVKFHVEDFSDQSVADCIARDAKRENPVGAAVIKRMAGSMQGWKLTDEWMNDVYLSAPYSPTEELPNAIIVDIDGTLAEHVARSPYDYSRVMTDGVHKPIVELVNDYWNHGYHVILMSGRPDIDNVRKDTEMWLAVNGISYDELHMRPGDRQQDNDADIKQDLFDEHVRDKYEVEFMLDDRDRVVRRMRKLGIKVLQVAEGDF